MAAPPVTHVGRATTGSKPTTASAMPAATLKRSKTTAPAAMPAATTPTAMPASATTPTAMPRDCRFVRDDAKRANRNACRQNTYCSLLHGVFPNSGS
jgi:hypothetical protein